jgi:hypothetical protein
MRLAQEVTMSQAQTATRHRQQRSQQLLGALLLLLALSLSLACDDAEEAEPSGGEAGASAAGVVAGGDMAGVMAGAAGGVSGGAVGGAVGGASGGGAVGGASSGGAAGAGAAPGGAEHVPQVTSVTIRAISPLTGAGLSGLSAVQLDPESLQPLAELEPTDGSGEISINVGVGATYLVSLSAADTRPHHIIGVAAEEPSTQVTFVSNDTLTSQVFGFLSISPSAERGIVVIGLDKPDLSPAVGASVELSADYDAAFALGQFGPVEQREITAGVGGFITFANVEAGAVSFDVMPPEGERCRVFSGEPEEQLTIPSVAGQVTVVALTCRPE